MCGRYNLRLTPQELQKFFELFREPPPFSIRYNIAPTQTVPVVRLVEGHREAALLRWGLIPFWAKDAKIGAKMINARSDTILEKQTYKAAFKRRRCLVPASGFYEWKGPAKAKQPFHIHPQNDEPMAFAGLWETWGKDEDAIESCAIITSDANSFMQPLHDRMPVILPKSLWSVWLDPDMHPEGLAKLLEPTDWKGIVAEPVSTVVNNVRNDVPECVAPFSA